MFDNRENSKISPFLALGGHNYDLSEKLTEIVSLSFLTSFRGFFRFSLRPIGAEIDGGCSTPPPVGGGESGVPLGRGLILSKVVGDMLLSTVIDGR